MYWVSQNPPPAHLFLISGDRDFAGVLHRLRMNNYNILLAIPGKAPDALCSAATIMWQWSSLLKGEDLTGKHFNHPPDGPFGSWYGNSKVPLQNPFSAAEQSTSSQNVKIHEPPSDLKSGGVPMSVIKQIRGILNSHPNGIPITDLRAKLAKYDVCLGKSSFGYKNFSRFLLSIPHVQLKHLGCGNYSVHWVRSESPEPFESSTAPSTTFAVKNEEWGYTTTPELNDEGRNMDMDRDTDGTQTMSSSYERGMDDDSKPFQPIPFQGKPIEENVDGKSPFPSFVEKQVGQPPNELQKSSLGSEKVMGVANAQLSNIQLPPKDNEESKTKMDSFKMRSKKSSDNDVVRSKDASPNFFEKYTTSGNRSDVENNDIANSESGKFKAKNKHENQTRKEVDELCPSSYSSQVDDSLVEKRPDVSAETYSKSSTFFSWIRSWWPFWKRSAKSDDLPAHQNKMVSNSEDPKLSELDQTANHFEEPKSSEVHETASHFKEPNSSEMHQTASHFEEPKSSELHQDVSHSAKPELFSNGSFWNVMESFVFTPKGSLLFSQSRSRFVCIIVFYRSFEKISFCYG